MFRIDLVAVKAKSAKGGLLYAEVGDGIVIARIVSSSLYFRDTGVRGFWHMVRRCSTVDDDASPEVLETMEAAANIHVDDTITPGVGLSSNKYS